MCLKPGKLRFLLKPPLTTIEFPAVYPKRFAGQALRRAFLCGKDSQSGQDYEHRRQWIEDRLLSLSNTFAIDIAAYAIMSNYYHVVLHFDQPKAEAWSTREVCTHWYQLFSGFSLSYRYLAGEPLSPAEEDQLAQKVKEWRQRLMDISWFMRCLNEPIARQANQEDKATGRFYKCLPWHLPFGPASSFSCSK